MFDASPFSFRASCLCLWFILVVNQLQQDTRAGLLKFLGWLEVLISFSLILSHSVPRHYTSCRGLVLRARECVFPAEAVPIRSLVTGRLALHQAGIEPGTLFAGSEHVATALHHPPDNQLQLVVNQLQRFN